MTINDLASRKNKLICIGSRSVLFKPADEIYKEALIKFNLEPYASIGKLALYKECVTANCNQRDAFYSKRRCTKNDKRNAVYSSSFAKGDKGYYKHPTTCSKCESCHMYSCGEYFQVQLHYDYALKLYLIDEDKRLGIDRQIAKLYNIDHPYKNSGDRIVPMTYLLRNFTLYDFSTKETCEISYYDLYNLIDYGKINLYGTKLYERFPSQASYNIPIRPTIVNLTEEYVYNSPSVYRGNRNLISFNRCVPVKTISDFRKLLKTGLKVVDAKTGLVVTLDNVKQIYS